MELKFEKFGDMISYKCPICKKELLIKTSNYFPLTNNCEHYKAYALSPSIIDQCPENKREVILIDNNGWKYVICRK
jgi:hypothetical protein